jgi:DNA-binding beta-propeller fold protein YncE
MGGWGLGGVDDGEQDGEQVGVDAGGVDAVAVPLGVRNVAFRPDGAEAFVTNANSDTVSAETETFSR